MGDQIDNVRLHPVLRALASGEDAEDSAPSSDTATDALAAAPIRQVLAGFIARPIAGVAPAPCQSFEYELVETDAGIGVRIYQSAASSPRGPHTAAVPLEDRRGTSARDGRLDPGS